MDTKICSKCNKELPLNSFRKKYKSEERADTCKSCCTELLSKGYKVCSRCNNVYFFTIEYFNSDKTKKSGFDNTCRTCTGIKIKTWSNENREKVCAHASAYLQTDKGKIRNRQRLRLHEARKLSLPSTFTNTQWEQTKLYFNNVCCYCGEKLTLEQDHFIALSKMGNIP